MCAERNLVNNNPIPAAKSDKRYLPRWQVNNRVILTVQGETLSHEGISRDVNSTGASLTTKTNLASKQKVKLKIYLSEDTIVKVEGRIIWNHPEGDGYLLGINFENLSRESQDILLQYAYEIKKDDIVKHWFTGWAEK